MRSEDEIGAQAGDEEEDVKMGGVIKRVCEKVELPHFSEIEAATRLPFSGEPVSRSVASASAGAESKMSIDFVKS
jgi:hypothetical protein